MLDEWLIRGVLLITSLLRLGSIPGYITILDRLWDRPQAWNLIDLNIETCGIFDLFQHGCVLTRNSNCHDWYAIIIDISVLLFQSIKPSSTLVLSLKTNLRILKTTWLTLHMLLSTKVLFTNVLFNNQYLSTFI